MKLPQLRFLSLRSTIRRIVPLLLTAVCLTAAIPDAAAQNSSTTVYIDALWQRAHAADCPTLILKEQKQTMTLGEADLAGYRIGESGQSGRTDCCLVGYQRQHPQAEIANDAMGVAERRVGDVLKYHVHGCHRFTPDREDYRMTLSEVLATPGNYLCEHCLERGPGFAQMSNEEWDKLPSSAPWVSPAGWAPSSFSTNSYPPQNEIDILLSETLHGDIGIQERIFINPVATVDNFVIMRFFFPVYRWLELYQAYRVTGDEDVLEQLRGSARYYNTLSQNYLSAAQFKAKDPEGLAYMYTMAASARITLQLALKYPSQVTAGEIAEAEDFLVTIISVLQPVCEDNSNLDPQMGIPQPLADDFRTRAFNRALNGIGTIGMATAALEDLQVLNSTTAYQSTIDRYRLIIEEYINNWKSTGFEETYEGEDYFSYPYSATDSGYMVGDVKLFGADDQGHFSHSMQGAYLLYDSVPELGVDDAFMTAIANTIHFNALTLTSGSPQTPSQEAIRPYSRHPYGAPRERFYMLEAFKDGTIDAQCVNMNAIAKESSLSEYGSRLATFNALYLKSLRQDSNLIHMGEESVAPPAAPTGLSATGSDGSVDLDWDDNSEGDLASYSVYRSTTSGSGYTEIVNSLGSSTYADSDVVNDTIYYYVVTASDNDSSVSANSSEVSAAPFIPNATPPAAPTGLAATVSDSSVSLDWADNGEGDLSSYSLYLSTTPGSYGAALATGLRASEMVDTNVVNGTTYYYVVTAVDHSSNESVQSSEISATPEAYGPTITFGSNNDGDGGFGTSVATGTEVWSLTADSVNYAFGLPATDEAHTASLLKSYAMDRSDGSSYTVEGVVDLTDGYGDDNNRIGLLLFNTTATQTGDGGGGLYLRLNADDSRDIAINNGINGTGLATTSTGVSNGDSWIGQTLTFTADIDFTNVGGTDKIDVALTLTDGSLNTWTASTQVDAASYTGTYFGFATKWRQRGDGGSRDTPPVLDYRSFTFTDNTPVTNEAPAFTSDPIVEVSATEDEAYDASIADNAFDPDSDPLTFAKVSGPAWLVVISNGDLIGTPANSDVGLNSFTVEVSDGIAPAVQATLQITVDALPNQAPSFTSDPIVEADATEDAAYSSSIADNASDPDSDPMIFSKVSGPSWLSVASNGALSGTPIAGDVGLNTFTVQVSDGNGGTDSATLEITVETAPTGQTTFIGGATDNIYESINWDNGLPTSSTSPGIINTDAGWGNGLSILTDYYIEVTGGTVTRTQFTTLQELSGGEQSLNGGSLDTGGVDFDLINGAMFSINHAASTLSAKDLDLRNSSSLTLNDGSLSVANLAIFDTALFQMNGGTATVSSTFGTPNFAGGGGAALNGGSLTADFLNYRHPWTLTLGGTVGGSATFSNFGGNSHVQSNVSINWLPGSLMTLIVTSGTIDWAETEWAAGRLTYNGAGVSTLGDWATVTTTGFGDGVAFAYDSVTQTLSLASGGDTTPPAAPLNPSATAGSGTVSLTWDDNSEPDLASYTVYRSTSTGVYGAARSADLSTSDYVDSVDSGVTYYYIITAVDANGNESTQSLEVISGSLPDAPALSAVAGIGSVELDWTDNAEANFANYDVYRSTIQGSLGSLLTSVSSSSYSDLSVTDNTDYYYTVIAVNTLGGESYESNQVAATPGLVTDTATSEIAVNGTVSGSSADVSTSDNVYQTITELDNGTTSILEHIWVFNVTGAEIVTFYVEAHHSENTEGDEFIFSYSLDDVNYTEMVTVKKTSDDNTAQYYTLPSGLSGSVYVRVHDADVSPGNLQLDTIYIDELVIESETSSTAPTAASSPSPVPGALDVDTASVLSWAAGLYAASHDVYFGTTPTFDFQGNQPGTTFDPGALEPSTTYYWAIDEVNSTDTTTGPIWSFTTANPPNNAPVFVTKPVVEVNATENVAYSATLSDDAWDADDDLLTFTKQSGPSWLNIASDGTLSGTPSSANLGLNEFAVEVSDGQDGTDTANLQITVDTESASMHVNSITLTAIQAGGPNRLGEASVAIVDQDGLPLSNATVTGSFSGDIVEQVSGTTDASGEVMLNSTKKAKATVSLSFTVDNVTHAVNTYEPLLNVETTESGTFN